MITIILAAIEAFGKNPHFDPSVLYIGTLIIDLVLFEAIANLI